MSSAGLRDVLDEEVLVRLAGPRSFARGVEYADNGAVGRLAAGGDVVEAVVRGTGVYRVRLGASDADRRLVYSCSCPAAAGGRLCKHCVAVGLCWLRGGDADGIDGQALRRHLRGLGVDRLVDLVLEQASEHPRLAGRLEAMVLRPAGGAVEVGPYRALLDRSFAVHGYISYQEAWGYFQQVGDAIDAVESLLEDGHAAEVVELTEHAVGLLDRMSGEVDDSDGGTTEAMERLEELHHAACTQAGDDPVALADRLFALAVGSELGVWSDVLERYVDVLGESGRQRFRELVHTAWETSEDEGARWLLTSWAEQLARGDGDVDRLVAIKSRDLKDDWGYLQVVEVLAEAGRADEALAWAERGLAAGTVHLNPALRDFVARACRASGRHADAVALRSDQLRDTPSLGAYQALKDDAEALAKWPERRRAALTQLREAGTSSAGASRWARRDRSTLVEIHLWEGDVGAAWEEAQAGGCSAALWRRLALARVRDRPEDTVAVYRRLVGQTVGAANNRAYEQAVELLTELEDALTEQSGRDEHRRVVADVRELCRRKRNFVKLLDERWPAASP